MVSEVDFLAMRRRLNLLEVFMDDLRERLKCPIVLATHHAGSTIPILDDENCELTDI